MRLRLLVIITAITTLSLTACAPARQSFEALLQRELNHDMRTMTGKSYDGLRGYRVVDGGVQVVVDSRYLDDEDTKDILGMMLQIQLSLAGMDVAYASRRSGYKVDPQQFKFVIVSDRGVKLDEWSLAHVQNEDARVARAVHASRTSIDMKAWQKTEATLPVSSTPSPLVEPHDFCADAIAMLRDLKPSTDPNDTLSALTNHVRDSFDCFGKNRSYVQASWVTTRALAEHALGEDSAAAADATLASQDFMKCSTDEYGTPEGAACQTLGMKMAEVQVHWELGF